jgi:aspartate/methionine/tyrosine aminotransferase
MATPRFPSQRSAIASFKALDVMNKAARLEADGRDIVHLEIGQPGGGAPQIAKSALIDVMARSPLGYTVASGTMSLRNAIAQWHQARYGVSIPVERIFVTTGSSAAFQMAFLAAFDPGAKIVISDPCYPSYRAIAQALGLTVIRVGTTAEHGWKMSAHDLRVAASEGGFQGVIVASPANPTGAVFEPAALRALIQETETQSALFISDEIYHGLEFGSPAPSASAFSDHAIVINSFSKLFRMTGWRVGWMIVPEPLLDVVNRLAQNFFICPPHAGQIVAEAAFAKTGEFEIDRQLYAQNRDVVLSALSDLGFDNLTPPDGAFYVYAGIGHLLRPGEDSLSWCDALLEEAGVAVAPGYDFDPVRGGSTVRLSICAAADRTHVGLDRLRRWLLNR